MVFIVEVRKSLRGPESRHLGPPADEDEVKLRSIELVYTGLLIVALVLNGVALAGSTPMRVFFAPLRETRLIAMVVTLDTLVVPFMVVGLAVVLGVDDVTRAGLVIIAAASAGPIGVALARVARGDTALSVSLVTGIGLLNLATVPLLASLLLPSGIALPIGPVLSSLVSLLLLPLVAGRLVARAMDAIGLSDERRTLLLNSIGSLATASLAGAIGVALFLEPELALEVLSGPVTIIAIVAMIGITLAARVITPDPARRRTIAVVVNARAVGLALAVTALYFGDVAGLRATVLTYGGLTQLIPILVVLVARRWERVVSR